MSRAIHIDGKEYPYKVFKSTNIVVKCPDGNKLYIESSTLTGMTPADIERGIYKKWFRITPSMIKEFVMKLMEGKEV